MENTTPNGQVAPPDRGEGASSAPSLPEAPSASATADAGDSRVPQLARSRPDRFPTIIAILTFFYTVFSYLQYQNMQTMLRVSQCAKLALVGYEPYPLIPGEQGWVHFQIGNTSPTPATILDIKIAMEARNAGAPPPELREREMPAAREGSWQVSSLSPRTFQAWPGHFSLTEEQIRAIQAKSSVLYFVTRIKYKDVLDDPQWLAPTCAVHNGKDGWSDCPIFF